MNESFPDFNFEYRSGNLQKYDTNEQLLQPPSLPSGRFPTEDSTIRSKETENNY
jgi:hypothetical protein